MLENYIRFAICK